MFFFVGQLDLDDPLMLLQWVVHDPELETFQDSQAPKVIHLHSRDIMRSPMGVKVDKNRAPDAPDNSDDDGSQPEHGKEAEAAGPKLDQAEEAEEQKAESGRRSSQCVATGAQDDDGHHTADRGDGAK